MPSGFPFRTKGKSDYFMQFFPTVTVVAVTPASQTTAPLILADTALVTTLPAASFTGTIGPASTALVVSAVTGTIAIGQTVYGVGVTAGTTISSGSGLNWVVNNSQTVGPEAMTSNVVSGVKLPSAQAGRVITVINSSLTYPSSVFPFLGDQINTLGANAAFALAAATVINFYCGVAGQWWTK